MSGTRLATNLDVLSEILEYLDPFVDDLGEERELAPVTGEPTAHSLEDRKTLFHLACTSRTISECALDVLWRCLITLRDLFKLFPLPQHCRVQNPTPAEWTFTSPDAITAIDSERFDVYAKRVHVLHLRWDAPDGIESEVIEQAASDERPLFPALRRLTLHLEQDTDRGVIAVLPPTVTILHIPPFYRYRNADVEGRAAYSQGVAYALQHVASTCLCIQEITVGICGSGDWEHVLLLSRSSLYLRRLTVSRPLYSDVILDSRLWQAWAQMKSLTHLSLDISVADSPPSPSSAPLTFLHLETLVVSGHLAPMVLFFQRCSTPTLTTLTIEASVNPTFHTNREDFIQCLQAVSQNAESRDCFRHFILHQDEFPGTMFAFLQPLRSLADVIHPFFALCQLETVDLSISLRWGILPTHADIEKIVASWPNLRTLRVDRNRHPGAEPLTFTPRDMTSETITDIDCRTLVMIAKQCFHLNDLAIMYDGHRGRLPSLSLLEGWSRSRSHPLQELGLLQMLWEEMTADTVEQWASFLDCLFPNLVLTELFVVRHRMQPGALPDELISSLQRRQRARGRTSATRDVQDNGRQAL